MADFKILACASRGQLDLPLSRHTAESNHHSSFDWQIRLFLANFRGLIAKKQSGTFFRIAVKGGGCSGFKYDFSFDNKIDENDLKHQNIVVDKSSLDMLKGSQVDFSEELIGNSFKISNPKTKSSCGCGVSFSF